MSSTNPTIIFPTKNQVVIEDRPIPDPAPGQLLIQTSVTLISTGTELTMLAGDYEPGSMWAHFKYPVRPGYNNIGRVIKVGQGVEASWLGKRLATYCGHARFVTVAPAQARGIPEQIADQQAVFFTIAEIVMNGIRRSRLTWGESAAVFGLGLLGQMAVRLSAIVGARPVFGIDAAQTRLDRLPKSPAIIPVNASAADVPAAIKAATRGRMADVAIELTGAAALIPAEAAVLRHQGRLVILSSPKEKTLFDFNALCNVPSITIIGAHNQSHPKVETLENPWTQHRHAELFFDLLADGRIDTEPLISHQASFADAPGLYQMLLNDRTQAMGVLLRWD